MRRATRSAFKIVPPGSRPFTVFYILHKLFCKVCAMMCPQAHNVCFRRTFMESVLTNYEISLYFGGELIAISNVLKYTEGIDFLAACPSLARLPDTGTQAAPAERSGAGLERLVQGFGRSGLADPAGAEYAAAAGDVSGRLLVGRQPLGLAHVGVSARCAAGACRRGAELLGLRQRAARPLQKGQAPPDRL